MRAHKPKMSMPMPINMPAPGGMPPPTAPMSGPGIGMKKGGKVKKMAGGGSVHCDGMAERGRTKGKVY